MKSVVYSDVEVLLYNRQRALTLDPTKILEQSKNAAEACLCTRGSGVPALEHLQVVEISIVSDRVIANVHRRFLNLAGATDVITFGHGEIIVSATTAARQAQLESEELNREVFRYIVHGLLHLNGHLDAEAADAASMWEAQENIVNALWPSI